MKGKRTAAAKTGEGGYAAKCVALSSFCGVLLCATVLMLFALLLSTKDLPMGLLGPIAVFSLVLGCCISGFVAARMMNCRGMLWGGVCGTNFARR